MDLTIHEDGSVTIVTSQGTKVLDPGEFILKEPKPCRDGYVWEFEINNLEIAQWLKATL